MKITIRIKGKDHELTLDEAKKLHAELASMFGAIIVIQNPVQQPIFIARDPPNIWPSPQPYWVQPSITRT